MRKAHDVGGQELGPIDLHEHDPTFSERQVDALSQLLRAKGFYKTDANRRAIEDLPAEIYAGSSYYERWTLATKALMIELGIITERDFQEKLADVTARLRTDPAA